MEWRAGNGLKAGVHGLSEGTIPALPEETEENIRTAGDSN